MSRELEKVKRGLGNIAGDMVDCVRETGAIAEAYVLNAMEAAHGLSLVQGRQIMDALIAVKVLIREGENLRLGPEAAPEPLKRIRCGWCFGVGCNKCTGGEVTA